MRAAYADNPKIVEQLLSSGADINKQNNDGYTALMVAAFSDGRSLMIGHDGRLISVGCVDTIRLLLEKGADVNAKSNDGETALDLTKTEEIKQLLRTAGAK